MVWGLVGDEVHMVRAKNKDVSGGSWWRCHLPRHCAAKQVGLSINHRGAHLSWAQCPSVTFPCISNRWILRVSVCSTLKTRFPNIRGETWNMQWNAKRSAMTSISGKPNNSSTSACTSADGETRLKCLQSVSMTSNTAFKTTSHKVSGRPSVLKLNNAHLS